MQSEVANRPADSAFILLLDFDGTLAEFNPDPAAPQLTPERWDLIQRIGRQPDMAVGIVSGRRLDDLRRRTRLPDRVYHAGLHGLEIEVDGRRTDHPDLPSAQERVDGLAESLARLTRDFPGAVIEDKRASVAVHARRIAPGQREAVFARADVLAVPWIAEGRVRRLEGDAVVEYLPNIGGHKGDATRWIVADIEARTARPAWVAYVGDDITDEDAFRAIRSGIGVLVGLRPTAATHKLNGIADVDLLLRWLAARE
ncbi:MAG: trehalose-phosphatase [Acidobacteria bacterium RIFCSPLOWO2_12_FULL_67_14b]|nr:MAG: trehalose-phosphatase [Acidobacteria bacterium RIFCSPLOWO2_12_FULL_67_14b]